MALPEGWKNAKTTNLADGSEKALTDKVQLKPFEYLILKGM